MLMGMAKNRCGGSGAMLMRMTRICGCGGGADVNDEKSWCGRC